jgi:arylsulfatase A-like enzyme
MGKQPNILVIWGDDIGISNLSCYSHGLMGYRTPNIDRLAKEGMMFTDAYGEQSCTAGRSSFITGQSVYRTGPVQGRCTRRAAGPEGRDVTIADLLKDQGYATGQFGKNHLGDRNEYLPTVHGFDEFFGNLYHLNAEEEPEMANYPKDPKYRETYGPRGVITRGPATRTTPPSSRAGADRQAEDRGHRAARLEANGDLRRRVCDGRHRLHQASARRREALLRVAQHQPTCTGSPTPSPRAWASPAAGSRRTTTR